MSPKSYRVILASHSSSGSPTGFSRDNLGLYLRESVCDKYQNFTVEPTVVAMAYGENRGLWIYRQEETAVRTHWEETVFL